MKISSPAGCFSGRVNLHAARGPNDPDQGSFWKNLVAADTGALGYMLHFIPLPCVVPLLQVIPNQTHRRVCVSSWITPRRDRDHT